MKKFGLAILLALTLIAGRASAGDYIFTVQELNAPRLQLFGDPPSSRPAIPKFWGIVTLTERTPNGAGGSASARPPGLKSESKGPTSRKETGPSAPGRLVVG
jgi:hypothetical protein